MKTILITGINGYLGSNLAKRYSKDYKIIGLEYSLKDLFRLEGSQFEVYASKDGIPDNLFYNHSINGIIHTATFYGRNNESNGQITYANMYLPQLLLEKAIQNNCSFFINTDTVLDKRVDTYSLSKRQFSEWLEKYSKDILTINVALEHFYGPFDNDSKFVTYVIRKMLGNEDSIDFTLGLQKRNFVYIEDVIDAFIVLLNNINKLDNSFHNFEVGTEDSVTIKDFVGLVKKLCNNNTTDLNFGAINYRENEVMNTNTNTEKLKSLGWFPRFSLEDGLKNTIDLEKKLKIE